jgi:putative two-component system response regulator
LLALELRKNPKFEWQLDDRTVDLLFKSAPLHDIGKVGIPDRILLKPGSLTPEEFTVMKTHTTLGKLAIESAEARLGKHVPFLQCAKDIAYSHQEKWDGSGYPEGLSGDAIPLSARLMAVADVYDALITRRVYKPAFTHEVAVDLIKKGRGKHFDPDIADAFMSIDMHFKAIAEMHSNDEEM